MRKALVGLLVCSVLAVGLVSPASAAQAQPATVLCVNSHWQLSNCKVVVFDPGHHCFIDQKNPRVLTCNFPHRSAYTIFAPKGKKYVRQGKFVVEQDMPDEPSGDVLATVVAAVRSVVDVAPIVPSVAAGIIIL